MFVVERHFIDDGFKHRLLFFSRIEHQLKRSILIFT